MKIKKRRQTSRGDKEGDKSDERRKCVWRVTVVGGVNDGNGKWTTTLWITDGSGQWVVLMVSTDDVESKAKAGKGN